MSAVGFPLGFGSPHPGSCCGGGQRDDAPACSLVSLRLDELGAACSYLFWAFWAREGSAARLGGSRGGCVAAGAALLLPESIFVLFCYRIWRSRWESRGSAFTLRCPRDPPPSFAAQPTTSGRDAGSGWTFGRTDVAGKVGKGGIGVKRRGSPWVHACACGVHGWEEN